MANWWNLFLLVLFDFILQVSLSMARVMTSHDDVTATCLIAAAAAAAGRCQVTVGGVYSSGLGMGRGVSGVSPHLSGV